MHSALKASSCASIALIAFADDCLAERNNNFVVTHKYAATADGYFTTPHQIKARAFWEQTKIIDDFASATITVANQLGYAAGSQTADVFIPNNYIPEKPVGIYIHISPGDSAGLPSNLEAVLQDHYLIGASPDKAGNTRHDPERFARVLDLVTTLKAQYNIDAARIYVGGLSGGALISSICGMLYPMFTGIIPTEHVMAPMYWQKIFTLDEMKEMAARGQRWSHILGSASYAYSILSPWSKSWKTFPARFDSNFGWVYDPPFDTFNNVVQGMTHTDPAPADFAKSLVFVDGRAQLPRVRTYEDWAAYFFNPEDSSTDRLPQDDFDGDGCGNWYEYLANTKPTIANDRPAVPFITISGTQATLHYRVGAMDQQAIVHTSTDLISWDTSGEGVLAGESVLNPDQALGFTPFTPSETGAPRLFYKALIVRDPPLTLTQLSGVVATQSTSRLSDGFAPAAIDGNTSGAWSTGSVSHTDTTTPGNWWKVDLGANRQLNRVTIYNRDSFQNRLSNFRIEIRDATGGITAAQDLYRTSGHVGNKHTWNLPTTTTGQTVYIRSLGLNRDNNYIITLAEVVIEGPNPN